MSNRPIESLYLHIPFCEHLCDYCDFTKLQYFRKFAIPYIVALNHELTKLEINHPLKTIYIGGGTPTSLENDVFESLLKLIEPYTKGVEEYTVECNPESLTEEKLILMKMYGVNRLSIGVESTDNRILAAINRKHTFEDVQNAILRARKMGFDNINVDLILGLPNVTKELLRKDLRRVVSLGVDHISCYSLTVHDNTVFGIKGVSEPSDDFARDLYDMAHTFLKKNGFEHYEISNWCKPGKESKHNLTYWKDNQYYGVGLGASGFVKKTRYTNTKSINAYLHLDFHPDKEIVTREEDEEYFIMLNLRTIYGINYAEYRNRFGKSFRVEHKDTIAKYVKKKLLKTNNTGVWPTYKGMMIIDQIILDFISD